MTEKTDISFRENTKLWLDKKKPNWLPQLWAEGVAISSSCVNEKPLTHDGYDWFGVHWTFDPAAPGGGAPAVTPRKPLGTDITKWKEEIKFPGLNTLDWKADGEAKKKAHAPSKMSIVRNSGGPFERFWQLYSTETALVSMVEEPEACFELLSAIADFKIEMYKKIFQYYGPIDIVWQADDWGHQTSGFFSESLYKELIYPNIKRIVDFVKGEGVYYVQHSCGNNSIYAKYMVEMGVNGWEAQANANDILGMAKTYGTDLLIVTNGVNLSEKGDATEEEALVAVRAFIDKYGPTATVTGSIMMPRPDLQEKCLQEYREYSKKILAIH